MTRPPNPELVQRIRETVADLVAEKGADGTTIREVAERTGVTTTTIHYYYKDKATLLESAKLSAIVALDAHVASSIDPNESPRRQLAALARALMEWSVSHPHEFMIVFEKLPPYVELTEETIATYYATYVRAVEIFHRGVAAGELRECDAELAIASGFCWLYGIVNLYLNKRLPPQYWEDPGPLMSWFLEQFLASVAVPAREEHPAPRRGAHK